MSVAKGKGEQAPVPVKRGRPTDFSESTAVAICERIAKGESIQTICKGDDMPHFVTVYRWLNVNESFRKMYAGAREEQADTLADEIVHIADTEPDNVRARNRIEARKWVAAKLKPRKYGDKMEIEHKGDVEVDAAKMLAHADALLGKAFALVDARIK